MTRRRILTPQQRYQKAHRERGLCIICPRRAVRRNGRQYAHCRVHLAGARERIRERRAEG